MSTLEIKDLHVEIEGKEILKGVNLTLKTGEIAAIMGPNGTGKSTLSAAIMGNPNYEVTKGEILFDGVNILELGHFCLAPFRYARNPTQAGRTQLKYPKRIQTCQTGSPAFFRT